MSILNGTKLLRKQGLDAVTVYDATVINNNDPRKLGRVRARIDVLWDAIPDDALPWAIPTHFPADGDSPKSGTVMIPKVGSKIGLRFPRDGDPHHPMYCGRQITDDTVLPESKVNYPDRAVFKFANGTSMIVDTRTNELFVTNGGPLYLTMLGGIHLTTVGNMNMSVINSKGDIPGHIANNPGLMDNIVPQASMIPHAGPMNGNQGNMHHEVKGNLSMKVGGNRITEITGTDTLRVGQSADYNCGSKWVMKAGKISLN